VCECLCVCVSVCDGVYVCVSERGRTNRVKRTGDLTVKTGGEGVGSVALPGKEINRLQPNQGPFDHNIAHLCTAP
jgi:hypothetical protein